MPVDERVLITRAQAGDAASYETLVNAYMDRLFRMILSVANNREDAEDALQETLLNAFHALPEFRGESSFSTWLCRIAINTTRNWIRGNMRRSSERIAKRLALVGGESPRQVDLEVLENERRRMLRAALLSLPDHYRDVLLLRHYEDLSYEQISQVLDIPIGTVRSRLAQARLLLSRKLSHAGYMGDFQRGESDEMQ